MIRGALEMVGIHVKAYFIKDTLRGDAEIAIRVEFIKVVVETQKKNEDSD